MKGEHKSPQQIMASAPPSDASAPASFHTLS
jgi:hypothetical protein